MNQEELELWIEGCINHYKKNSTKVMATIEERMDRIEQAHSRLFNKQKEILDQLTKLNNTLVEEIGKINTQLDERSELELLPLPDKFIEGRKSSAEITEVISKDDIVWRNMNYTNWELKLKGNDHIFLAFIKTEINLDAGALVNFEYEHYLKLKHLKIK